MDQLKGSLRFIPLPAVTQFVAGLGSTGRLQISQGPWSGEIALGNGQVVGAQLGAERGRPALDGLVLALTEADFAFVDGQDASDAEPLLGRDELAGYMAGLVAERERLQPVIGMLNSVPCLIDQPSSGGGAESSQVTIQAAALQLIPALVYGHTLEQIAQRRGLARTLREISALRNGGLVRLEATPAAPPMPAQTLQVVPPAPAPTDQSPARADQSPARHGAATPAPAPSPADQEPARRPAPTRINVPPPIRPLRPVPTENRPAAQPPRRAGWWQTSSAVAPATIETPRPRLVTDEPRPHLEALRPETDRPDADRLEQHRAEAEHLDLPRPDAERLDLPRSDAERFDLRRAEPRRSDADSSAPAETGRPLTGLPRGRSWRSTLVGLFLSDSAPQV
jgi:hypothetical protein